MEIDKFYNEDCQITMSKMPDEFLDLVMTSPPYNLSKRQEGHQAGRNKESRYDVYVDNKTEDEYLEFTENIFNDFNRVVKNSGIVLYNFSYSVESPSMPYKLVSLVEEKTNWRLADTIIWKKNCGTPFPADPRHLTRIWEFVFVFAKKENFDSFICNKGVSKVSKTGQSYYHTFPNFIEAKNNDGKTTDMNQCTYSSDMVKSALRPYVSKGMIVYDPFMGTGTTAVACVDMGLHYIGSEISKNQVEYSEKRILEKKSKTKKALPFV